MGLFKEVYLQQKCFQQKMSSTCLQEMEKKREERRIQAELWREWRQPRDDMDCDDLKVKKKKVLIAFLLSPPCNERDILTSVYECWRMHPPIHLDLFVPEFLYLCRDFKIICHTFSPE